MGKSEDRRLKRGWVLNLGVLPFCLASPFSVSPPNGDREGPRPGTSSDSTACQLHPPGNNLWAWERIIRVLTQSRA